MQKTDETQSRLDKQFAFLRELDKEKQIIRQTYLADGSRLENDAEHAWHMAVMALFLSEYSNEKIDLLRTISMILLHDVVEIDAGDTYAYDEVAKKSQTDRERQAADRLFGLLPDDQGKHFKALWEEFEERKTPEARFAKALDNFQPLMLNAASDGKSWEEHGVRLEQVLARNGRSKEGAKELWSYVYEHFIMPSVENGKLKG
ncbi:MAG: HD domain-containing protein [Lachnospiraceae bacterium]|nr:HD domain-containing protein [Lachnospiraceae bacterium]